MSQIFTTRPEIRGTFGVVASTHWIASAVAMSMLERGGNAFDAAVAGGLTLQIVEPHLNGPSGEVPILLLPTGAERPTVLCGQGVTPAGATIAHYRSEGLTHIPGTGLLAAVIPGAFDAWMTLLRDHGRLEAADVMAPAIHYARHGHPLLARVAQSIRDISPMFREHWKSSADIFMPGGDVPETGKLFANPTLADTYQRIVDEAKTGGSREARIDRARDAFYRGFVAEAIERFATRTAVMDASGAPHKGVITAADMAGWRSSYETPLSYDYHGHTVFKTGPWGQGPVLLQQLALLKGFDIAAMDPTGPDFVHVVTECMKLAFADREAYYGDPAFGDVPMETLLSDAYNDSRRALVGEEASKELRPGTAGERTPTGEDLLRLSEMDLTAAGAGGGEPTMAHLGDRRGDTCHIDVIDRDGNMVSATPSGGWLQSSPVVPGLGFPLNSRGQMFWLKEGLPASLAPGKRPRTTLTPSIAFRDGKPYMAFGTPGGDQQDQWQTIFLLRHIHHGHDLQRAIDGPLFHTEHMPSSFYPRQAKLGCLTVEENFGPATIEALKARGHEVTVAEPWSVGRMCAAAREEDGVLKAAATPRLMQAYAMGR
ncbi:gamma-glutamyltransferase family protein [Inquilinus sp. CAU 1745]|uniref:gamma-glutamyltransferase family protein n=1 Tax=Inquilinus sp. CAU 1745 TaxID=3140369 RepID=UPI00325A981C